MNNYKLVSLVLLIITGSSCGWLQANNNRSNLEGDEFYRVSKIGDLYRFPLIKPFEVISTIGYGPDWFINLEYGNDFRKDQIAIDSVTVNDSLIIAYSHSIYLPGEMTEAWFIIDLKEKEELAFRNANDYLSYLSKKESLPPPLFEINFIYENFKGSGTLPWQE